MLEIPPSYDGIDFGSVSRLQVGDNEDGNHIKVPLQGASQPAWTMRRRQNPSETSPGHPDVIVKGGTSVMLRGYSSGPNLRVFCAFDLRRRYKTLPA